LILVAAVGYAMGYVRGLFPSWPKLGHPDLEVACVTLVLSAAAFAGELVQAVSAIRRHLTGRAIASLSICAASWGSAFALSWIILYFE
jgi:hypothetical protein